MPAIGLDERVSEILSDLLCYCEPDSEDVRLTIGRIVALVEEERAACIEFLRAQAAAFQVLIDHAPTPVRAEDLKRVKRSIEIVIGQVRARSMCDRSHIGPHA